MVHLPLLIEGGRHAVEPPLLSGITVVLRGSSPRAWGSLSGVTDLLRRLRFIPARVGEPWDTQAEKDTGNRYGGNRSVTAV